ncbi:insulin-like growth factor-binding protein complex acid labile subunit [Anopheles darlingi]|uniref:insulin-like growth factor-binding protein complex acid labile subunit n=1 Tax=Anopheles darlingi TaxID=43151 RepID=UPI0021001C5C|nr:insulin-like growth factor-binding protein complex acid labile subunit [Anopheles darlingi]
MFKYRVLIVSLFLASQLYVGWTAPSAPLTKMCYYSKENAGYECVFANVQIGEYEIVTTEFFAADIRSENITSLVFQNSTIFKLPKVLLSAFPNATVLKMEHLQLNTIEQGAFDQAQQLEQLYLNFNNISQLEPGVFSGLQSLFLLDLDGNGLLQFPAGLFPSASNLYSISIMNNRLTRIEDNTFANAPELGYVYASSNNIEHFDLSLIPEAVMVNVSYNRLTEVKIPTKLKHLYASNNRINRVLSKGENKRLKELYLSHNKLTDISWVAKFPELKTLDLRNNELTDVVSEHFPAQTKLKTLLLKNNRLVTFDLTKVSLEQLRVLDLSNNQLTSVERNSALFDKVQKLYLQNNSIKTLKLSANNSIKEIWLTHNDWDCANLRQLLQVIDFSATLGHDFSCKPGYTLLTELCCKEHNIR